MKILVRLPNWLGDLVMSTAFLHALKEKYPHADIHLIVKKELCSLAGMMPHHTIHPFTKKENSGLNGVFAYGKPFRRYNFDLFFCLPDSFSSAVMGWASGAKNRIGFKKEFRIGLLNKTYQKPVNYHRTDEYLFLLEQYTGETVFKRQVEIASTTTVEQSKLLLINFNSEALSRRLPLAKAAILLMELATKFDTYTFGLIGSEKEADFVKALVKFIPERVKTINYAGQTDLISLTKLISSAAALLTTDSGPAHLANALHVPCVVLFGAGNEHHTSPYNKENLSVIRYGKLACEPCVKNKCVLYDIPKCMELLDEKRIIENLKLYLKHA